jgi:hypothetical protein
MSEQLDVDDLGRKYEHIKICSEARWLMLFVMLFRTCCLIRLFEYAVQSCIRCELHDSML